MKFFKLLKKELMELITFQAIGGILVGVLMFVLLGSVMGNMGEAMTKTAGSVVVADQEKGKASADVIAQLQASGFEVQLIEGDTDPSLVQKAAEFDHSTLLVIPATFGSDIDQKKPTQLRIISELKGFSLMGNMDQSAQSAAQIITDSLSTQLIGSGSQDLDVAYVKNPIVTLESTVVKDKSEMVNPMALQQVTMQQSMFIPIIVFILIVYATQLNASAIANEKSDKTLETLLSAPVSRLAVLSAKMCASAVFSLLMAGVFMVGFSSYMGGMMNGMTGGAASDATSSITTVLQSLGLQLGAMQYALIGIQLFLTISIALTISVILGALAKDLKSAQSLIAPLMFVTMIPYFITMFMDVNTLPMIARILVYAIPFTHTFTATSALLFDNNLLLFGGMTYQIVILAGVLFLAVRVFSTDKIFTMTLEFKKKHKVKKIITQD